VRNIEVMIAALVGAYSGELDALSGLGSFRATPAYVLELSLMVQEPYTQASVPPN